MKKLIFFLIIGIFRKSNNLITYEHYYLWKCKNEWKINWIIIWKWMYYPLKLINYLFYGVNGRKMINYWKILEMNRLCDNFIGCRFNSIQFWKKFTKMNCFSQKKDRERIDSVNLMYDHESPKVFPILRDQLKFKNIQNVFMIVSARDRTGDHLHVKQMW